MTLATPAQTTDKTGLNSNKSNRVFNSNSRQTIHKEAKNLASSLGGLKASWLRFRLSIKSENTLKLTIWLTRVLLIPILWLKY